MLRRRLGFLQRFVTDGHTRLSSTRSSPVGLSSSDCRADHPTENNNCTRTNGLIALSITGPVHGHNHRVSLRIGLIGSKAGTENFQESF